MKKIIAFLAVLASCALCFSAHAQEVFQWGWAEAQPVPADYDGDGAADLAVYHQPSGRWYVFSPSLNTIIAWGFQWGFAGVETVPADYDGDGAADLAVYYRPAGQWFIYSLKREAILAWGEEWGWSAAGAVPADYDGDGRTDLAVYHRPSGQWYLLYNEDPEVTDTETLRAMYSNAVVYASQPRTPADVYTRLTAVTTNNPVLQWRWRPGTGELQVKAASFMSAYVATNFYHAGYTTILPVNATVWATLAPELKNFMFRYNGTNAAMRAKQVLGLPPESSNNTVVEFWVDKDLLIRPSPDPEITDHESEIDFSYAASRYLAVSQDYIDWFQHEAANKYDFNGWPYPWTRMGYTYDWAKTGGSVVGLSEVVIPAEWLYLTEGIRCELDVTAVIGVENYALGLGE